MPRKNVPTVVGETYHIFNRGVDKRIVFNDKVDYHRFHQSLVSFNTVTHTGSIFELQWRKDWINEQDPLVKIHAYCILNNHYHLLLTQLVEGGISEFMKRLSGGYTLYFNERNKRSGILFQGKYKKVHCQSNEQLLYLAAYVNLNNKVHDRNDYFLSSFDTYLGQRQESFVKSDLILSQYKNIKSFETNTRELIAKIAEKRKIDANYNRSILFE